MRNPYSDIIMFSLVLLLAACGGQGSVPDVTGNWTGQINSPNGLLPFSMSLTQNGTSVEGTVTLEGAIPVTGSVAGNVITLGFQDAAGDSIQIGGTVDGNSMTGTMTLS